MAHGDAREGRWMEWVASTLHTTSERGVSSITTADAPTSAASSRLNWRPRRFKWTRPFRRKTKSGFCACAITFQLSSTYASYWGDSDLHSRPEGGIFWLQYFVIFFVSLSKLKYRRGPLLSSSPPIHRSQLISPFRVKCASEKLFSVERNSTRSVELAVCPAYNNFGSSTVYLWPNVIGLSSW